MSVPDVKVTVSVPQMFFHSIEFGEMKLPLAENTVPSLPMRH